MKLTVKAHRAQIHKRIRKKVMGTAERPRLSVFRSSKGIYCQIIDDIAGHTLAAATHKESEKAAKTVQAQNVGTLIAEKAKAAGVVKVVFDRGGFLYHGRVKALADAARAGGLEF